MDGCTEIIYTLRLALCQLHYSRHQEGCDLGGPERLRIIGDDEARFWSKVDVRGSDECHPWTGSMTGDRGYFYVGGKMRRATRYLLEVIDGVDIRGLHVCHTCDNPICVNRRHLFVGTQRDNMRDMDAKGRRVNPGAKVTVQFVRDMRALYDAGHTPAELAETFRVNYHTMHSIVTRHRWKSVA